MVMVLATEKIIRQQIICRPDLREHLVAVYEKLGNNFMNYDLHVIPYIWLYLELILTNF